MGHGRCDSRKCAFGKKNRFGREALRITYGSCTEDLDRQDLVRVEVSCAVGRHHAAPDCEVFNLEPEPTSNAHACLDDARWYLPASWGANGAQA